MDHWLSLLSHWLAGFRLHAAMQDDGWIVPTVQTVHIIAIGFVFPSSLLLSLRALGLAGTDWSPAQWGRRLNPWLAGALLVLLGSGTVLIVGEPARSLLSPVFQVKMVLVVIAAALAWLLGARLRRIDPAGRTPAADKALAGLVVLLWMAVISCGRWIAYYAG
ncbi:MAG: DUF6644 family protein [Janthinobacterium lividum]